MKNISLSNLKRGTNGEVSVEANKPMNMQKLREFVGDNTGIYYRSDWDTIAAAIDFLHGYQG